MKPNYRLIGRILAGGVLLAVTSTVSGKQIVRETWDGLNVLGNLYPANQAVTNGSSSVGFVATSPWITNPAEHDNNTLLSIRGFFTEPWLLGLPPNYNGVSFGLCQDNSFQGGGTTHTLWTAGDWMVRALQPGAHINFNSNAEYFICMHVGMDGGFAQYVGALASTGAGGIGFADGATTNAHFVAIGCTGTNVFLGPPDGGNPLGTINAGKSVYISTGTLGQPGNTNSLLYHGADGTLTNFTGGPYYINAFSTNRQNQCQGDGTMVLGHLVTHAGGNATMEVKFYNPVFFDQMDLTTNTIAWDCSYSFNYTGVMSNMLVFENGQFPLYVYDFRVGTKLADVIGMDAQVTVTPRADLYANSPLNLTNHTGLATTDSNPTLAGIPNYGTISYQWQQNGTNIANATNTYFNIASVAVNDPVMPAGSDAGTYTCISADVSGTWGSVTSPPVVVTVTVDNVAPAVMSVTPSPDFSTVTIVFSEVVNGAGVVGHYAISGGLSVTNVATSYLANNQTIAVIQTSAQLQSTKYTLTFSSITDLAGNPLNPATASFWSYVYSTGFVDYDAWDDPGDLRNFFITKYPLPTKPKPRAGFSGAYTSWEAPEVTVTKSDGTTEKDNYGGRLYGWFIPPVTTNYVFFISADDAARLSLSTNDDPANLCVIAVEDLWSPADNWTNYSSAYPTGDHRGSGVANKNPGAFGGTGGAWDSGPDQNRSDEFILAYNADIGGLWTTTALGFPSDVAGSSGTNPFWPTLDSNGNALITLQAGKKYFLQAEHQEVGGGANLSVTYKIANNPGDRSNDPATGTAPILTGIQIAAFVPFQPSLSISNSVSGPVITFAGTLAASTNVQGPYIDVPSATNPYQPTGGGTRFFRTHQ